MLLNCGVEEDSCESLGLQRDQISQSQRKSVLNIHWKDGCWGWNSNTLATWCEELTYLKRPWCWEKLKAGREGDNRGLDGWMASLTWWTWVWADSRNWWWTGKPGMLQSVGVTELDTTEQLNWTHCTHSYTLTMSLALAKCFVPSITLILIASLWGNCDVPISWMRKLNYREIKWIVPNPMNNKWQH